MQYLYGVQDFSYVLLATLYIHVCTLYAGTYGTSLYKLNLLIFIEIYSAYCVYGKNCAFTDGLQKIYASRRNICFA